MSRTKGVNSAVRHQHDEYITAPWCVKRFVEKYFIPKGNLVLDPCASRGELLSVVRAVRPDLLVAGIEINPDCVADLASVVGTLNTVKQDFLKLAPGPMVLPAATILTNPPYVLAQEFIEHSLKFASVACFLLRLNFLGGRERRPFTATTSPGIFILPNRPCFNGWGSDACEYGWFVYGDPSVAGKWFILDTTPEKEISAWNKLMRARYPKPVLDLSQMEHGEAVPEAGFLDTPAAQEVLAAARATQF